MRKVLLFLAIMLFSGLVISSCSSDEILQEDTSEATSVIKDKNAKAREAGKKLLESFGMTETRSLRHSDYPDYYGGAYINKNGKLVVFVKGNLANNTALLTKAASNENVIYTQGNHSYAELRDILTDIALFIDRNKESQIANNIKCFYLNDFENNVTVELENFSDTKVSEFKTSVTGFSGIVFKQHMQGKYKLHSLSPGSSIGTASGGYATMGYRASRFGADGFVTAGHAYDTDDQVRYNGTIIGSCEESIQSGSVDAAFVRVTNFSYMPDNGNLAGEENTIWAGDNVTKLGHTISQSDGYITSTSLNANVDGIWYSDIAEATYMSAPGDSGGPIYLTGNRRVVGIHQGSSAFNALFVKVSNISWQLNAHFY